MKGMPLLTTMWVFSFFISKLYDLIKLVVVKICRKNSAESTLGPL